MSKSNNVLKLSPENSSAANLPRPRNFTRAAIALANYKGELSTPQQAEAVLRTHWRDGDDIAALARYCASTVSGVELPDSEGPATQFLAAVLTKEIVANIGAYQIELNTRTAGLILECEGSEVAPGRAIPISQADFYGQKLDGRKVAALLVASKELLRTPLGEKALQSALLRGILKASDASFLANAVAFASAPVADNVMTVWEAMLAVDALTESFADYEGSDLSRVSVIMHPDTAIKTLGLRNGFQQPAFPEIERGKLRGLPLLLSRGCDRDKVIAVDASRVTWANGTVELTASDSATLEMRDNPTGRTGAGSDNVTAQSAPRVSMFQVDAVGIKVVRVVDYSFTAPGAVGYIAGFNPANSADSN